MPNSPAIVPRASFFPRMRMGLARDTQREVVGLVTVFLALAVDARAFLEDLRGGSRQVGYVKGVKWRLLELLFELEVKFSGLNSVDEVHHAALALEYGLHEVAVCSGENLVEIFGLTEGPDAQTVDVDELISFWNSLLANFPGVIPDPLVPAGQGAFLRALRNCDRLCASTGTNPQFIRESLEQV